MREHSAENVARPACDCAPDCAERIACEKVGMLGHAGCGWCGTHDQARHLCLCPIPPAADRHTCRRCGGPLGDAFDSDDHACPIPPAATEEGDR